MQRTQFMVFRDKAITLIKNAERDLGYTLSRGQRIDLLMDNTNVRSSVEASKIIDSLALNIRES